MKCAKKDLLLYAVTDRRWLADGETLYQVVEQAIDGGVTFVQLREKELAEDLFLEEAKEIKKLCNARKIPFVINDSVDIALAMDADGVHVGQSDMEAGDVREKLGPDKIIGVSAQTVEQAKLRLTERTIWVWERYLRLAPRMTQWRSAPRRFGTSVRRSAYQLSPSAASAKTTSLS